MAARKRPPHLAVLRNFESKLRLLQDELNREFRRPEASSRRLWGLSDIIDGQVAHVQRYHFELLTYNARQRRKAMAATDCP